MYPIEQFEIVTIIILFIISIVLIFKDRSYKKDYGDVIMEYKVSFYERFKYSASRILLLLLIDFSLSRVLLYPYLLLAMNIFMVMIIVFFTNANLALRDKGIGYPSKYLKYGDIETCKVEGKDLIIKAKGGKEYRYHMKTLPLDLAENVMSNMQRTSVY